MAKSNEIDLTTLSKVDLHPAMADTLTQYGVLDLRCDHLTDAVTAARRELEMLRRTDSSADPSVGKRLIEEKQSLLSDLERKLGVAMAERSEYRVVLESARQEIREMVRQQVKEEAVEMIDYRQKQLRTFSIVERLLGTPREFMDLRGLHSRESAYLDALRRVVVGDR